MQIDLVADCFCCLILAFFECFLCHFPISFFLRLVFVGMIDVPTFVGSLDYYAVCYGVNFPWKKCLGNLEAQARD